MMVSILFVLLISVSYNFYVKSMWNMNYLLCCLFISLMSIMFPWAFNMYHFSFFMDYISFFLSFLSLYVVFLMFSSSSKIYKLKKESIVFGATLMVLLFSLCLSFTSDSAIWFYFFFEFSLIPTMILIMGWGYQIERVQSTLYFLMYTLFASLPLLVIIMKLEESFGGLSFSSGILSPTPVKYPCTVLSNFLLYWMLVGAFLVKLPMFFFHLWLPKAHVEAPVSGSMILAGVLLKLGGYGLIRILPFSKKLFLKFSFFFMSMALISIIFISITCLRSNDLKSLIAYSSVAHMGLSLSGLVTVYLFGLTGNFFMLIGHGVCSSGLFSYINMIYERSMSRSLFISKGILSYSLLSAAFMFLLSVINMGAPPSMNLFSELMLVSSSLGFSIFTIPVVLVGSFLVAAYSMTLFSASHHGKNYSGVILFAPLKEIEYLTLFSHAAPLFISFYFLNAMA